MEEIKKSLERKMDYIGIDVDDGNIFNFLLTYLSIKKKFSNAEIIVEISPSGAGFHITAKLDKPITVLQNFLERSIFEDDPYRLKLNLKKLYISNGRDTNTDLLFTEKAGKKCHKIEIEKLLSPHRQDIEKIYSLWGGNEALEIIKGISEKIDKSIRIKKHYVTCISLNGDILRERINKISQDINKKDGSFRWKIFKSFLPDSDYIFCIFSRTKNQAHQRGAWFKRILKKELNQDILYWVKGNG